MKLIDYSINKFEQETREKGNKVIPSPYTVLIMDDDLLGIVLKKNGRINTKRIV